MQHPDPARIYFDIHDIEAWLPLIEEESIIKKHPRLQLPKKEEKKKKDKDGKKRKTDKGGKGKEEAEAMQELKYRGDYMRPNAPFYDPKAMEPPLSIREVEKLQGKIHKEVEMAIKQNRSSRNLNAYLHNTSQTRTIIAKYLDFLEDRECGRLGDEKEVKD